VGAAPHHSDAHVDIRVRAMNTILVDVKKGAHVCVVNIAGLGPRMLVNTAALGSAYSVLPTAT
jgi:hypothetical protein